MIPTAKQIVKVGQIWSDYDSRLRNGEKRLLRVDAVTDRFATCTSLNNGRVTRLSIERMKPTGTGYRLEQDSDGSTTFLQELRELVCDSHDAVRIAKAARSYPGCLVVLERITRLSDGLDDLYERWAKADGDPR